MNPHRMTWGIAYDLPFGQLIALTTLAGMIFSKEPKHLPWTPVTVTLLVLILWMNVTLVTAIDTARSLPQWEKVMKIFLMLFVTMYLLHTRKHVQILVWIVVGSVAYFGIKGGLFTIRGGGAEKVYGPPGGYISDNNGLALALVMMIPMLRYIQVQATKRWFRWGLTGAILLCGLSVLGSQSRGAFLAISAMLLFLWFKSRNKLITALVLVLLVPLAIGFMPQSWDERMHTIQTYQDDNSALGRLNAWGMAINLTKDRPLVGGGFEVSMDSVFARYAPEPGPARAAHSIYFSMLGEHGYVGLGLFLLFWTLVWRNGSWIIRQVRDRAGWQWASELARMVQVSLVGYFVGGAFLSLAYFDVAYYLAVMLVLTRVMLEKELGEKPGAIARPRAFSGAPVPANAIPGTGRPPVAQNTQGPIQRISSGPLGADKIRNIQPQINADTRR
jgi:probable O-glycosylation ligase (exosortase A-associated)